MTCMTLTLLLFSLFLFCESHECGDGYMCPDISTCCRLVDGNWGCCPLEEAVCCEDHLHCCPRESKCDTIALKCINSVGETSPIRKKSEALKSEIICPDKKSKCPSGSTCCKMFTDKYGCCPTVNATCCFDHMHCCPYGYRCDPSGQRCIELKTDNAISSLRKHKATTIRKKSAIHMHHAKENSAEDNFDLVRCGYGTTCPAFNTCCEVIHNERIHHMCCPIQNGVCCKDTCCPSGYHCRSKGFCEKHATWHVFLDF